MRALLLTILTLPTLASFAMAQIPATQRAATLPALQPGQARVIALSGAASYAIVDAQGVRGEWRPIKVGDLLPRGTQIRTQLRSKLGLAFGDSTVVLIERATLASIDQFERGADSQKVSLGLGHGMIRASAVDATLRSDMTIQTPTATLSKRGTRDFGIEYEPSTGRFRVWLGGEGLVEALSLLTRESRLVYPGQYVTQAMIRWIETLATDRWVPVVDTFGQTPAETQFNRDQGRNSGLAVANPGGGYATHFAAGQNTGLNLTGSFSPGRPTIIIPPTGSVIIPRPEGNFGTGIGPAAAQRRIR